ncbi:endonuclease VII domain-containing protein [Micromonospora sp. MED01]|uniref:endonuclease domain-containing protein n=1 Tax=Micromonospora alfalfae TaxID=2911212 RepID=UPI001EE82C3A|nr:endonuclease domain-containing protein [Micromonospora alfalfae]MCG5464189.1 endonuclease VII domain-containing protein [Micromonospora alfalfae]
MDVSNTLRQAREQRRAARMAPLFHGTCTTHESYRLSCRDYTELRRDHDGRCALCGDAHGWMNIDHDHELGIGAIRGLLCPACNAGHMRRIDAGERAIDDRTRRYLIEPWYLRRQGLCLAHDPRLHISVSDLSRHDRREVARLAEYSSAPSEFALRRVGSKFERADLSRRLAVRDYRPIFRLVWMFLRGWHDIDIAAPIKPFPRWASPTGGVG